MIPSSKSIIDGNQVELIEDSNDDDVDDADDDADNDADNDVW